MESEIHNKYTLFLRCWQSGTSVFGAKRLVHFMASRFELVAEVEFQRVTGRLLFELDVGGGQGGTRGTTS